MKYAVGMHWSKFLISRQARHIDKSSVLKCLSLEKDKSVPSPPRHELIPPKYGFLCRYAKNLL